MPIAASVNSDPSADEVLSKSRERRALSVACGAHALHDGYTDLIWVALPIWQAEFALSYAAVGLLRMIYSGTMASLQIPAARIAERLGAGAVLALGTAICGLCYCLAGAANDPRWLAAALFLGGCGAATQHPIGSALVTRVFTGERALTSFGTYNFSGDVGKVLLPGAAAVLILFMPWRPAYAFLGLLGIAAALGIFLLTPRLAPEAAQKTATQDVAREKRTVDLKAGFAILVVLGIADSLVRGAFFVLLPFLLMAKGATVSTAGLALTLVFIGGAAGKLACGWIAKWIGMVATVAVAQSLTAAAMFGVLVLPLKPTLILLPVLGIALNGVTTVIYGSVPGYAPPERRTQALSVFYTLSIGSAALSPPLSGLLGDLIGIANSIVVVSFLTLGTIPLAFALQKEGHRRSDSKVGF